MVRKSITSCRLVLCLIVVFTYGVLFQSRCEASGEWVKEDGVRIQRDSSQYYVGGPAVVQLPNGAYRMYYSVSPSQGDVQIVSAYSTDGLEWEKEGVVVGNNASYVDIITLPDGYRMYYRKKSGSSSYYIVTKTSDDGLSWTQEQPVGISQAVSDTILLADGKTFRMYYYSYDNNCIHTATSSDGVVFTDHINTGLSSDTGFIYTMCVRQKNDGTFEMYNSGANVAITYAHSTYGVNNWILEPNILIDNAATPEVIELSNGTLRMYYTDRDYSIYSAVNGPVPVPSANQPPVVDAGPNIMIDSADIPYTQINGTASDPDSEVLIYNWVVDAQGEDTVDGDGNAPLDLAALLRTGTHEVTLIVSDGENVVQDSMILTVNNSAPEAVPQVPARRQLGNNLKLRGTVSDFDGDTLTYKWYEGGTTYDEGEVATYIGEETVDLPVYSIIGGLEEGSHDIILEVSDGFNTVVETSTVIYTDDFEKPSLDPVADPAIVQPQAGAMVSVTITVNAEDNSGDTLTITAVVTCNKEPELDGDGNPVPNFTEPVIDQANGIITLDVRSGATGKGTKKVYRVKITVTDESGNTAEKTVKIVAVHSRG